MYCTVPKNMAIKLLALIISINLCFAQNRTGNYTQVQIANIKNIVYESERFDDESSAANYIFDHLSVLKEEGYHNVLVYSGQTNNAEFNVSASFMPYNKSLVLVNLGTRNRTYILWKAPTTKSNYKLGQSNNQSYFSPQIQSIWVRQIEFAISDAINHKGQNMHENANYLVQMLRQIDLGQWVVVITSGTPKMDGYVRINQNSLGYCYLNNYQFFKWNYLFYKLA